jgi:NAD(P)H-hydrate epimerase
MINRFTTEAGIEVPAVSASQMHEVDRIAVQETGPTLFQMMENAGRTVAQFTLDVLKWQGQSAKVVVLVGSGGNGGGGLCAARHLANRSLNVDVCYAEADKLNESTAYQRKILNSTPAKEIVFSALSGKTYDLIIDALIGNGLNSAPRGETAALIRWSNESKAPILSLDVPSGVDATTGETPGEYIRPRWTIALALPKTGLSPERTGMLFLADLGIPPKVFEKISPRYTNPFGGSFLVSLTKR